MGSLAGAKWENLAVIIPCVFIATLFFCTQSRILNMMLLGDEVSITLGTDLHRYRQVYLVVTALVDRFCGIFRRYHWFVGLLSSCGTNVLWNRSQENASTVST